MVLEFFTKGMATVAVIAIFIGLVLFWISMILDCLKRSFERPIHKPMWFFLMAVFLALGAGIYWLMVYRKK